MNTLNPEQLEAAHAMAVHAHANLMAFRDHDPQDVAAATAAILQAAFIIATADLTPERRAALFTEDE